MLSQSKYTRTIAFDLDDTLYDECDYVSSGKNTVASLLKTLCGKDVAEQLHTTSDDFLDAALQRCGLPDETKLSLLWVYRLHRPTITCRPGVIDLWERLRSAGTPICIITDGRFVTQSLKIEALGLNPDRTFISELVGAEKPSFTSFRAVEIAFPAMEYVYVGDNPAKDFIAPHQLGWRTFGLTVRPTSIHKVNSIAAVDRVDPETWVENFAQLTACLFPA
jgi:putative hydrolase of the HAD superfamily